MLEAWQVVWPYQQKALSVPSTKKMNINYCIFWYHTPEPLHTIHPEVGDLCLGMPTQ